MQLSQSWTNVGVGLLLSLSNLQVALSLDCSRDQLDKYRLKEIFSAVTTTSLTHDTPPSQTKMTWYLNLCSQVDELAPECPKHAQICGVQEVLMPGQEPIKTQVIAFGNGLGYKINDANNTDIMIDLDESSWGTNAINAHLELHCGESGDNDGVTINWDASSQLNLKWQTPAACLKGNKEVPVPPKEDKDVDDSWGWFTWLFIIVVLIIGVYIIFTSWVSSSRTPADFQDAAHDFVDTLKSLPGLSIEVLQRITGSQDRGGYSAV